jgi:hypothetical protein
MGVRRVDIRFRNRKEDPAAISGPSKSLDICRVTRERFVRGTVFATEPQLYFSVVTGPISDPLRVR